MSEVTRYRCTSCGNRTRFDVLESRRARLFHHYSLGGELEVEEEEILEHTIEKVTCRWCGRSDAIAVECAESRAMDEEVHIPPSEHEETTR